MTFFGGKGGVGKTTCAAGWAVARANAGRSVLVVSTDPAHSLRDVLDIRLTAALSRIPNAGKPFSAVELDARRALARWLSRHGRALGDAIEHGTWLERDDVDALLKLSVPGADELVALLEIARLAVRPRERGAAYDEVIVDTAPTGHTLRLLNAPETVAAVARVLDELQHPHRIVRERLARWSEPDAADRLIEQMADEARRMSALLRNQTRTEFHWVTLAEEASVAETRDGLQALDLAGLHLTSVIVNEVLPPGGRCSLCDPRRVAQRKTAERIRGAVGRQVPVKTVYAQPYEPRGVRALASLGRELVRAGRARRPSAAETFASRREPHRRIAAGPAAEPGASFGDRTDARLLLFGGKGGVGKTTVAAATALRWSREEPERRILLVSMDPAHSLGDILRVPVSDREAPVWPRGPRLHVRELDAAAMWARRRFILESAFDGEGRPPDEAMTALVADQDAMRELLEIAPPGIDELFGMLFIADLLADDRPQSERPYDLVIVDTAPTGHALRLLEMPKVAREWVNAFLRMLLKYRHVAPVAALGGELVSLSKSIRSLRKLLQNPAAAGFIVVTRPASLPRLETERLIRRLRRMGIAVPALIINATTPVPTGCSWCRIAARSERREIAKLIRHCRRAPGACAIIQTPRVAPPPQGIAALLRWAAAAAALKVESVKLKVSRTS